ncbi:glycosyltransferase family 4 protein [Variovorax boronicumulans]|uniref:glycosyltransferase family 4 protein n=1 Tax=Variovorax boronicumulans TaxID=436515 RepID=UPI0027830DFE|nr:glycosyltransferase family 4 protein [Variovorax boronicumulans]MDQ0042405.1 glycosyltransferase involved in cell wall biosynthesis [Variovorax boronicumulans]
MNFRKILGKIARFVREYHATSLLKRSGLFDKKWYLERNPDVQEKNAISHFLRFGGREGRAPSAEFDSAWYMENYKDVGLSGINPLVHYLKWGVREKRRPAAGYSLDSSARGVYSVRANTSLNEQENLDMELLRSTRLFDPDWYLKTYPHLKGQDPYLHFLRHGGFEGLKASEDFDCDWYGEIYPDVVLHHVNPLLHYLKHGIKEGRFKGMSARTTAVVKKTVADLMAIDPEIESCHPLHGEFLRLRPNTSIPTDEITSVWLQVFKDLPGGIEHILFMPWLVKGGADLAGVNMLRAAQESVGVSATLLVLTDHANIDAFDWLPSGSQVLVLSDYETKLSERNRQRIVEALIFTLQPASIMNVNSRACWALIAEKGRALKNICRIHAALFCRDFTEDGRGAGYADTHLRAAIKNIDKIYFDTEVFLKEIVSRYGLTRSMQENLEFLPQPALDDLRRNPENSKQMDAAPAIFWAGRFCHQKNTELLGRIIQSLPDVALDIYGGGEKDREVQLKSLAHSRPGVHVMGPFASFSKLPLEKYAAFLFTSRFEGMPTVLINAAAAGIPIIASNVGGVSELVTNETGWLIDALDDEKAYCAAMKEILSNPEEVVRRQQAMRRKLGNERSWAAFKSKLSFPTSATSQAAHV